MKNQITKGEWVVRGVERVDKEKRHSGSAPAGFLLGQDPYYSTTRVNFDGTGLVVLTEGDGTHAIELPPDCRFSPYLVARGSGAGERTASKRRRQTGCELERADAAALVKTGWQVPERFVAKARDGVTDIYGVINRPTNFYSTSSTP